ncbi:MAG: hypothetical protein IJK41_12790 [Muribaculaceae bacterium]|nr:hypothetical protein [Muribaculaceae bacterium]
MAKDIRHLFTSWRLLLLVGILAGALAGISSCGSDEPDMKVGYYLSVSSSEAYMASSEDEGQGTMSDTQHGNVLYTTITRMKNAVQNAYPTPDTKGADVAVLMACGKIYRDYKNMYGEYEKNTICVVKIMRTKLDDGIVVGSRTLTTYSFGALPPDKDHVQ